MACGVFKASIDRCHNCLDHPLFSIVQRVVSKFNLPCLAHEIKDSVCNACQQAKSHHLPYPKSTSVSNHPLELVFSNVSGPAPESAVVINIM
jgi:hypothetical protein